MMLPFSRFQKYFSAFKLLRLEGSGAIFISNCLPWARDMIIACTYGDDPCPDVRQSKVAGCIISGPEEEEGGGESERSKTAEISIGSTAPRKACLSLVHSEAADIPIPGSS